jgi:hypothetical protein
MSSELKMMLNNVALKEIERKVTDFEKDIDSFKSLLQKLAKDKKIDVLFSLQGVGATDSNKIKQELELLEKAHLVKGQTKYTHRNEYRQYELTAEGIELAKKLSKET